MKTVLFHTNQLSIRGTEVALFDYARFNEELLGNRSIVITPRRGRHTDQAVEKFSRRFSVRYYEGIDNLNQLADEEQASHFYAIKSGEDDGILVKNAMNCIHVVFKNYQPHGDVYAYISPWLRSEVKAWSSPVVPHMVSLDRQQEDLRAALSIPPGAIVVGCYGGEDSFDIPYVQELVMELSRRDNRLYFLFMNIQDFSQKRLRLWARVMRWDQRTPRVRFLPGSADLAVKSRFINTCDVMLHARSRGETFGLACGEFSVHNRPVIACSHKTVPERCHLEILGSKGLFYRNSAELRTILNGLPVAPEADWDAYSRDYSPARVMEQFNHIFLGGQA